jgi:hypothetical protein
VPAFHLEWFTTALKKGFVETANPFRPTQKRMVRLGRDEIDGFIFWTRRPRPLLPVLFDLDRRGVPSLVMVTLNAYPTALEPAAPSEPETVAAITEMASQIGRDRIAWRYDPVLLSSDFDVDFHRRHFRDLAGKLAPHVFRAIVSLYDPYRKAEVRLRKAGIFPWTAEQAADSLFDLVGELGRTAADCGLEIRSCAESGEWANRGVPPGKCVDDGWFNRRFGMRLDYEKDPSQRPACLCQRSVDIGAYGTCRFRCAYCYAW